MTCRVGGKEGESQPKTNGTDGCSGGLRSTVCVSWITSGGCWPKLKIVVGVDDSSSFEINNYWINCSPEAALIMCGKK